MVCHAGYEMKAELMLFYRWYYHKMKEEQWLFSGHCPNPLTVNTFFDLDANTREVPVTTYKIVRRLQSFCSLSLRKGHLLHYSFDLGHSCHWPLLCVCMHLACVWICVCAHIKILIITITTAATSTTLECRFGCRAGRSISDPSVPPEKLVRIN
jgi:hypothetical protein